MEVFQGIRICDDTDHVVDVQIVVQMLTFSQLTGVPENITIVLTLCDDKLVNTGDGFYRFPEPDRPIELSHGAA